jgi:hypothetical protein
MRKLRRNLRLQLNKTQIDVPKGARFAVPPFFSSRAEFCNFCLRDKSGHRPRNRLNRLSQKTKGARFRAPFQQNPINTPSQKRLGHHHPGKIKNHLPVSIASALPRIGNTCTNLEPLIQQGLARTGPIVYASLAMKSTVFHSICRSPLQSSGEFRRQWQCGWPRQEFRTIARHLLRVRLQP